MHFFPKWSESNPTNVSDEVPKANASTKTRLALRRNPPGTIVFSNLSQTVPLVLNKLLNQHQRKYDFHTS